jgi:hypothetical protein
LTLYPEEDSTEDGKYDTCAAEEVENILLDLARVHEPHQERCDPEFGQGERHHAGDESDTVPFDRVGCCRRAKVVLMSSVAGFYRHHDEDGVGKVECLEELMLIAVRWLDMPMMTSSARTIDRTIQKSSQPLDGQQLHISS